MQPDQKSAPPPLTFRRRAKTGLLWGLATAAFWIVVMEILFPGWGSLLVNSITAVIIFPTAGLIWSLWASRSSASPEPSQPPPTE